MSKFIILVWSTVLSLGACDTHRPVGVGTEDDASAAKDPGIIGTWVGSIRRPSTYHVPWADKVPTQVRITIGSVGNQGVISGTVVFGPGSMPPFNPNVGFPSTGNEPNRKKIFDQHLQQGFPFSIRGGTFQGSKVTINLSRVEQWKKWCEAQKVLSWNGKFSCFPLGAGGGENSGGCHYHEKGQPNTYIDCSWQFLCLNLCECDSQKCSVPPLQVDAPFDLTHAGDTMKGQVLLFHAVTTDVELTRQ